jgi:ribosomal protein S12 methylthiotransferase
VNRKVFCLTLGCDKNLVDSEALLGIFRGRGVEPVAEPDEADIWVLNSCGFIEGARTDSADTLREMSTHKGDRLLVVCGCWSQEHGEAIQADYPAVDLVAGVGQFERVVAACTGGPAAATLDPGAFPLAGPPLVEPPEEASYVGMLNRPLLTPPHVAFVKIAEGCNCACTFCRIPLIRGKQRSRPVAEIVTEVRGLVAAGVGEIQLVSQNTSDFGRDTGEHLVDLVTALDGVDGLRRQRLLYLYAGLVKVDELRRLLDLPTVAPYLDLPVQHGSPRILKAMRRPGGAAGSVEFFAALRRDRPDLVLRSTALLGFPGEEEEDVALLADFLAAVKFDHLGTYRYSPEAGTPAAELPDPVPQEISLDREALIMDLQAEISQQRQETRLGRTWTTVIDRVVPAGAPEVVDLLAGLDDGVWVDPAERATLAGVCEAGGPVALGRSEHYGYDLDGLVALPGTGLAPGQWLEAEFRAVSPHDTWARSATAPGRKGEP